MGIVFLGLALIPTLVSLHYLPSSRAWQWTAVASSLLAAVCVVIAYALVADQLSDSDPEEKLSRGPAFGLAVTAWVLQVLAVAMLCAVKHLDKEGYTKDAQLA